MGKNNSSDNVLSSKTIGEEGSGTTSSSVKIKESSTQNFKSSKKLPQEWRGIKTFSDKGKSKNLSPQI